MTLQLLHPEFHNIRVKIDFIFYQCSSIEICPKPVNALGVNVPVRHYCRRDLIKAGQGKATTVWYLQGCKQAVRLVLDNIGSFPKDRGNDKDKKVKKPH